MVSRVVKKPTVCTKYRGASSRRRPHPHAAFMSAQCSMDCTQSPFFLFIDHTISQNLLSIEYFCWIIVLKCVILVHRLIPRTHSTRKTLMLGSLRTSTASQQGRRWDTSRASLAALKLSPQVHPHAERQPQPPQQRRQCITPPSRTHSPPNTHRVAF